MSKFRVKIKEEIRIAFRGYTWELQRRNEQWDKLSYEFRDEDEWEYVDFGEARNEEQAIMEAKVSMDRLIRDEELEAKAKYVELD